MFVLWCVWELGYCIIVIAVDYEQMVCYVVIGLDWREGVSEEKKKIGRVYVWCDKLKLCYKRVYIYIFIYKYKVYVHVPETILRKGK